MSEIQNNFPVTNADSQKECCGGGCRCHSEAAPPVNLDVDFVYVNGRPYESTFWRPTIIPTKPADANNMAPSPQKLLSTVTPEAQRLINMSFKKTQELPNENRAKSRVQNRAPQIFPNPYESSVWSSELVVWICVFCIIIFVIAYNIVAR